MDLSVLQKPMDLTAVQLSFYRQNAYIKIRDVIPAEVLLFFNKILSDMVTSMLQDIVPFDQRNTYGKAFLQLFNLWKTDETIKELVFSKRLAKLAADLMEVEGVRMYHDQALFKEGGGGITPWHADQYYWPLTSDKTITAWIPLQATPLDMGPLEFCPGSQNLISGRELSISDESEEAIKNTVRINNLPHVSEAFDIGEISFHSGWIFHRAGANKTNDVRKVMTVIYMDKNMTLKKPENSGQENDWKTWCPGVKIGEIVNSPLNPVLFER